MEHHFDDRLLLDYQDRPFIHEAVARNNAAVNARLHVKDLPEKFDCVHGHFLPTKYDIAEQNNVFITWIRNPYERVMSRYYFGLRTGDFIATENISVYEFCELKKFHNFYEKYLWNFDIEKFRFIGITEDYESSVNLFRKQFGIDNVKLRNKNINPYKQIGSNYNIESDLRALIYKKNRIDFEVYQRALEINKTLQTKYPD